MLGNLNVPPLTPILNSPCLLARQPSERLRPRALPWEPGDALPELREGHGWSHRRGQQLPITRHEADEDLPPEAVRIGRRLSTRPGGGLETFPCRYPRCPVCKSELVLEASQEEDGEVITGQLTCSSCRARYPIDDRIPDLLPPELREATA